LICNRTSYVEILYLTFRFSPAFTISSIEGKLKLTSLLGALLDYIRETTLQNIPDAIKIDRALEICFKNSLGPLIFCPEGTSSNGKLLLRPEGLEDIHTSHPFHLISFKYEETDDFSPTFPCGNFFLHLLKLCSRVQNQMKVKYVLHDSLPPLPSSRHENNNWSEELMDVMASTLNIKRTKLTLHDKVEFLKFWKQTKNDQRGSYTATKRRD